jgi:hypothetical protein
MYYIISNIVNYSTISCLEIRRCLIEISSFIIIEINVEIRGLLKIELLLVCQSSLINLKIIFHKQCTKLNLYIDL